MVFGYIHQGSAYLLDRTENTDLLQYTYIDLLIPDEGSGNNTVPFIRTQWNIFRHFKRNANNKIHFERSTDC